MSAMTEVEAESCIFDDQSQLEVDGNSMRKSRRLVASWHELHKRPFSYPYFQHLLTPQKKVTSRSQHAMRSGILQSLTLERWKYPMPETANDKTNERSFWRDCVALPGSTNRTVFPKIERDNLTENKLIL